MPAEGRPPSRGSGPGERLPRQMAPPNHRSTEPPRPMPCATIHMLTAGSVLRSWSERPDRAPFPVERSSLRRAFLLGAMGPDMGFVPGVDRFVSELAHYVDSADLTRRLLGEATHPAEAAFAWGWATHHVTDVEIHPLVGRACGERLLGDRTMRLNSSDDLETHVAMEVGLDLLFLQERPDLPRPPADPALDGEAGAFLARSLRAVYGLRWDDRELDRSYRTAAGRTARWPSLLEVLGRAYRLDGTRSAPGVGGRLLRAALGALGRLAPSEPAAGLLRPLAPPAWMVARVRAVARHFPERFQELVEGRLAGLENRNLETGRPQDAPVEHPDSRRTLERLQGLRGASDARVPSAVRPLDRAGPPDRAAASPRAAPGSRSVAANGEGRASAT